MSALTLVGVSVLVPLAAALVLGSLIAYKDLPSQLWENTKASFWMAEAVLAFSYGLQAHTDVLKVGHVSTQEQVYATTVLACLVGVVFLALLTADDMRNATPSEPDVPGGSSND